jgi:hypothetical protein
VSAPGHIWKFSINVPAADEVHATVHAFLRTSEYGSWTPDSEKQSDTFVLHYRRGTWSPPPSRLSFHLTGIGTYEQFVQRSGWDGWKTTPMLLSVSFRPMPSKSQIRILLDYQLAGPDPAFVYRIAAGSIVVAVADEAASLARYVFDNLELPALPTVEALTG